MVTPFDRHGDVDAAALHRLAGRLLEDGAAGLVALGTTGEPATLAPEERRLVVEICDRACRDVGRPLIVGAGTNSTRGTIDEIDRLTRGTSAVAALVVVPYYTRPSELAVVGHFAEVATASPVPIVAYNVPYRTGCGLGARAMLELSRLSRVVGLKQAAGALDLDTLELLAGHDPGFQVLAGDDAYITPTMLLGGAGAIAASAHLATGRFAAMIAHALAGEAARAVALAAALLPLVKAAFDEPNPAVVKGALARRGELSSGELRRPMTPASPASVDRLLGAAARVETGAEGPVGAAITPPGGAGPG